MGRKKSLIAWLICSLLCLSAYFPAWAYNSSSSGGSVPKAEGTDIVAGVVVDYMGKLRFVVLNRDTQDPIQGASVELYIPSLHRFVLFGLTDSDGIYELDVASNMNSSVPDSDQFIKNNEKYEFKGTLAYLEDNKIQYRIYKSDWLLYPHNGRYTLTGYPLPEIVTVHLYQEGGIDPRPGDGSESGGGGGQKETKPIPSVPETSTPDDGFSGGEGGAETSVIPKTGVEGTFHYWALGLLFFLLAAGALWKIIKLDNEGNEKKRRG